MIKMTFNDKQVRRALRNIKREIKNPKKLLTLVGQRESQKAEERILQTKTDPDNKKWSPWAYSTLQRRIREGNAAQGLLYRTGGLLRSFYYKITRTAVMISTNINYAKYLQFGTPKMPKREFLGWGKDSFKTLPIATKKMINKFWR